jgi:hypothetical protein
MSQFSVVLQEIHGAFWFRVLVLSFELRTMGSENGLVLYSVTSMLLPGYGYIRVQVKT